MKKVQWLRKWLGHSYFKRIFYLTISTLVFLVIISGLVFYFYIENNISKSKYETDMEMLMQIEKNFENTNNLVVSFLKLLYEDRNIREIMASQPGKMDLETVKYKLRDISTEMKIFAPYIHSVYIFTDHGRNVYASFDNNVSKVIDLYLLKTIHYYNQVPQLTPILRKIKSNDPDTVTFIDVFSYFLYNTDDSGSIDTAIILNIYPQWFLDNFYKLNPAKDVRYFLMASNREFVNVDYDFSYQYFIDLTNLYFRNIVRNIKDDITFDIIPCNLNGVKNLLSYIYLENEGFIIYKVQTYESVYASVNQIKTTVIIIMAFIVLIALFLSLLMSRYIYKPFGALVKTVRSYFGYENESHGHFDELLFLENYYIHSADEISLLRREINSAENIKYKYYLTQLLVNSSTVTESEIKDISNSGLFNVNMNSTFMLIIVKLNSKFTEGNVPQELGTWLKDSLIKNLSLYYVNDVIDLEKSSIVAIINTGDTSNVSKHKENLYKVVKKVQDEVYNKYTVSFAAAISDPVNSVNKLSDAYFMLRKYLNYSFIYGDDAIITNELVEDNLKNTSLNYPFADEQKLVSAIKRQDFPKVVYYMDKITAGFKKMSYNNIVISLVHLCNTIRTTVNEINKVNFSDDYIGIYDINPVDYQTIDDLLQVLKELVRNCCDKENTIQKHSEMVKIVKNIVCNEYTDPNLNLAVIAGRIRISPNYLNCIFKNSCGISISDYITDYRLSKAAELLKTTGESINSVMNKVGMVNASTFYRCFKSKFGTTPKNYILATFSN
mgnify:FL=1